MYLEDSEYETDYDEENQVGFPIDPPKRRMCGKHKLKDIILGVLSIMILIAGIVGIVYVAVGSRSVKPEITILISIDGFSYTYLKDGKTHPNIHAVAEEGMTAEMVSVFPSKTFPNHYSIITGLYAEDHGIVSNKFYNPETGRTFEHTKTSESLKSDWWLGEPFWNLVNRNGMKTASFFWPGSEAKINGSQPTYYIPYDMDISNEYRVQKVLEWIDMPPSKRPSFITLYFSDVDTQGHNFGPGTPEVNAAIKEIDDVLGLLFEGMKEREDRLAFNTMVVSDHGMAFVQKPIFLEQYIDVEKYRVPDLGTYTTHASLWALEDEIDDLLEKLSLMQHAKATRKEELPERHHYSNSVRIAPIQILPDEGYVITTEEKYNNNRRYFEGGDHGYDPLSVNMTGIFIGHGELFRKGVFEPKLPNVEVFNLLASIMGLTPPPNNGTTPHIKGILKQDA